MTLKAVLFDLDDTLLDTSGSRKQRAQRAYQRLMDAGMEVEWRAFWPSLNALDVDGFYRRGMAPVIRDLGLTGTDLGQECVGLWSFQGAEDLIALLPGCVDMLEALEPHYRLGVVTNGPEDVQANKFFHTGLGNRFELFLASGEAGVQKPDPRIFEIALERMGVAPAEAVFIGDHLDLDVIGAQRAGLYTVWFNPKRRHSEHPHIVPDATIHSLSELPAGLEKLI